VHPKPFLARHHQARLPQVGKVPGNLRLGDINHPHQVANAKFARLQKVENAQACPICKCPKHPVNRGYCRCGLHIRISKYSWIRHRASSSERPISEDENSFKCQPEPREQFHAVVVIELLKHDIRQC
jgi:hypothetical protein